MPDEISKIWILEQFDKIRETLKHDTEVLNVRLSQHVTRSDCAERRAQDIREIQRIDNRIDDIYDEVEKTKVTFEKKWDKLDAWIWKLLAGVLGQLGATIIGFLLKFKV